MPSADVGGDVRRNRALNCWPCVRSLTHSPDAVIHSPASPQNAKAILDIMVGDPLDQPRQHLSIGWIGLRLHDARRLTLHYSAR